MALILAPVSCQDEFRRRLILFALVPVFFSELDSPLLFDFPLLFDSDSELDPLSELESQSKPASFPFTCPTH